MTDDQWVWEMLFGGEDPAKRTKEVAAHQKAIMAAMRRGNCRDVIESGIAGGFINPATGKLVEDDGKVTDKNGWKKEEL